MLTGLRCAIQRSARNPGSWQAGQAEVRDREGRNSDEGGEHQQHQQRRADSRDSERCSGKASDDRAR